MMYALNDLATAKSTGSQETAKATIYFLNDCASNPNDGFAIITSELRSKTWSTKNNYINNNFVL